MSKTIGIDLGTTNSCVSIVEGGHAVIIPNDKGERTTPSVVAFSNDGTRLVGSAAAHQATVNAKRTISSIKRQMGTDWRVNIDGKSWTPQEISAMILRKLRSHQRRLSLRPEYRHGPEGDGVRFGRRHLRRIGD